VKMPAGSVGSNKNLLPLFCGLDMAGLRGVLR